MRVYVVLEEDHENEGAVSVLGVYLDEEEANNKVGIERNVRNDENVWYQESEIKKTRKW